MDAIPIRKINLNLVQPGFFTIRRLENVINGKDLFQDVHRHEYYLILAIRNGEGNHEIDFTNYNISDYSIFVMRPGQVHQLAVKNGATGILVQFGGDFYNSQSNAQKNALNSCRDKQYLKLDEIKFKRPYELLQNCLIEFDNKEDNYYDMIRLNLIQFFYEFARQTKHLGKEKDSSINLYVIEKSEEFKDLLEKNLNTKKQVSDYAEIMNLSVFQLNSILHKAFGKKCSEIINDQILLEAKRQLLATSEQVSQIAFNLGFEDVSYFIRFFKKHLGITPESFRKNSI